MKKAILMMMVALVAGAAWNLRAGELSVEEQQRRDRLHIAAQQLCPVSGVTLGEHGPPVRVTVGKQKEEIFLCCRGCLGKNVDPKHWATVHANLARAQQMCPVMKKELPARPKWTIVEGRIVYVCCPPCVDRIEKNPSPFLEKVDDLYAASLKEQQKR